MRRRQPAQPADGILLTADNQLQPTMQIYVGFVALVVDLVAAVLVTYVLRAMRNPDGADETSPAHYHADEGSERLKAATAGTHRPSVADNEPPGDVTDRRRLAGRVHHDVTRASFVRSHDRVAEHRRE